MVNRIVIFASLRDYETPRFFFRLFLIPTVRSDNKMVLVLNPAACKHYSV